MPDGMISPRPQPPIRLNRGNGMDRLAIVCPVCETDQFERLDLAAGSGKCVNRHHVMRRDTGVWYCPDTESPPPDRCRCGVYPPDAAHMCEQNPPEYGFESVRVMRLQPGDVIVVQYKDAISQDHYTKVAARMRGVFPDHRVVVLDSDTEISVARPDADLGSVKPNPLSTIEDGLICDGPEECGHPDHG
jgi:hypothetical protein